MQRTRWGAPLRGRRRNGATSLSIIAELGGGQLARRARHFGTSIEVWYPHERALLPAVPTALEPPPPPSAAHLQWLPIIEAAGAEPVVEHGVVAGEVHGLEVCRVVDEPTHGALADVDGIVPDLPPTVDGAGNPFGASVPGSGAILEVGVGAADRQAFALLHGDVPTPDALRAVVDRVRTHRAPGAPHHPLNRLCRERMVRWSLSRDPAPIGLVELDPVEPPLARRALRDVAPCVAVGHTAEGRRAVVVCSVGVDLDLAPYVADVVDHQQVSDDDVAPRGGARARRGPDLTRAAGAAVARGHRDHLLSSASSLRRAMGSTDLIARLRQVSDEYDTLERALADPEVLADSARLRTTSKRYSELGPVVTVIHRYEAARSDVEAATELLESAVGDERTVLHDELAAARTEVAALEDELRELMLPKDPNDGRAVIVEIRGAEGGEEANLFARDLYEMYTAYAAAKGWRVETISSSVSAMGGFDEVTFIVKGDTAWRYLKFEGGPHRVQRVPATESQGRIHTSSATVTVLPEADEIDVSIDERDLDIDVYRSSGAGGQHVNTTDSAVRITHRPSGLVVTVQDERSQLQNRARGMQILRARLYERAAQEHSDERSAQRRAQVGGGGRSEKIRTYNFKENRVTDHRIGHTVYRLADVLAGDLDLMIQPLQADERARLLAEGGDEANDATAVPGGERV